jgi:uncharacterized protein (TIGR02677 family)
MERRPWRVLDADLFRFATTDLRTLHVALMTAFEQAAVLAPALNLDQVRAALTSIGWDEPISDDTVQSALGSLTAWGLLDVTQDHSARYSTPEEFERKNLQWSLTARGDAAIGGLLHALDALRQTIGLQTAVLDAIGDDLAEIAELATQPRSQASDDRIHVAIMQVERHLTALVASVRQFNGHLQRLLRDDGMDDEVFADVKQRTVSYLEEYVEGVERPQRRLLAAVDRIETIGRSTVFDRALVGAHLAPVATGDPAPSWLAERERRWQALRAWFAPYDAAVPLLAGLLDIARTAIIELLRVLERRWDARRRSASIAHDFTALAGFFAAAPGDEEAHALFAVAFGMWSARHAHLRSLDGEARAPATSWLAAAPVEVAPALRTTGTLATRGRSAPIADPAQVRAARVREQAERLATHDSLRASLTTDGLVRLAHFTRLPKAEFAELLEVLAAGLAAPLGEDGARRAMTIDGCVEITLRDPHDGRTAVIGTDDGELTGPDMWVEITLVGAERDGASRTQEVARSG